MKVNHKLATGLIKKYMQYKKFNGWTSLWNSVYYIDEFSRCNNFLRRHELCHIEQMKRLGKIKFLFQYMWYDYKYGYKDNPFEIEAREAERGN